MNSFKFGNTYKKNLEWKPYKVTKTPEWIENYTILHDPASNTTTTISSSSNPLINSKFYQTIIKLSKD